MRRISKIFLVLAVCGLGFCLATNKSTLASGDERKIVSIYVDGQTKMIATFADTVGQALKAANIELSPYDRSVPAVDADITNYNFSINVYRAQPVTIVDGNHVTRTLSSYQTPSQVVDHAGIKTSPEDKITRSIVQNILADQAVGKKIVIHRAKNVTIDIYGTLAHVKTSSATVGELLKQRGISLQPGDKVSVELDHPITQGMIIDISRKGKYFKTVSEPIAFTERQVQDVNRPIGYVSVQSPGKNGQRLVVYQTDKHGKIINPSPVNELVTLQPVQQVVVVGAKVTTQSSASSSFSGDLSAAFAALRQCEAGGNYGANTGNGYYGAYQYDASTWANYGGYALPSDAPPQVQDQKALMTYNARGWSPWPSCSSQLGL